MSEYDRDYKNYVEKISFQYSCNMCIIQIGELVGRLSDEFITEKRMNSGRLFVINSR